LLDIVRKRAWHCPQTGLLLSAARTRRSSQLPLPSVFGRRPSSVLLVIFHRGGPRLYRGRLDVAAGLDSGRGWYALSRTKAEVARQTGMGTDYRLP
jgi:hypothetical protein